MGRALRYAVAALAALLVAQSATAGSRAVIDSYFGPAMVRAELVVMQSGAARDFRIDRGRITALGGGTIRLRELDGTVVTIPVAPDASIVVGRRAAPFTALRRGMNTTVVREGDAPARFVVEPAFALPHGLAAALFGPRMVRAEVIALESGGVRDLRIDRGRITAARGGTIRLRERDGTVVNLPVAPDAAITLNGRTARFAELRRGLNATIVREGEGAASIVEATER
jgi:hypothetical protein